MLAEKKAGAIHWVARNVLERLEKPVVLKYMNPENAGSDFLGQANLHFSRYELETSPLVRAESGIEVAQQLINLSRYRQAREFLAEVGSSVLLDIGGVDNIFIRAAIISKHGWIADYQFGYFQSRAMFGKTLEMIGSGYGTNIPEYPDKVKQLYSTAKHFSGRANYGLAVMGVRRRENVGQAVQDFTAAQDLDQVIDDPNKEAKIGFAYAWKARCWMLVNEYTQALQNIELATGHFQNQLDMDPRNFGLLAHMYLIEGEGDLLRRDTRQAREAFDWAATFRHSKEGQYSKGLSDAYLGLAECDKREHNYPAMLRHFLFAVIAHRYNVLLKGVIGG